MECFKPINPTSLDYCNLVSAKTHGGEREKEA